MIINTGQRTDIPAFYSEWFAGRLREGFVCVRNPYNPYQVSRYRLDPAVVDCIGFCTKNPSPMFRYMDLLSGYGQFWFVTITPYGRDIEPNVPDKHKIIEDFKTLSGIVGKNSICWRYDPIFITDTYTEEYHISAFSQICEALSGYTDTVVISFIDLYPKVRKNLPGVVQVTKEQRLRLGKAFIDIAGRYGLTVKPCAEGDELKIYGADTGGCMTLATYEKAIGKRLVPPVKLKGARSECACYLACDIGAYNTCLHLCRYCYANYDASEVLATSKTHDPKSPFIIGNYLDTDIIHEVKQTSWIDMQIRLDL